MAIKVDPPAARPAPIEGEQDLDVLHPERAINIAGRQIVVREYGFVEGLRLRPLTQPILDALYQTITARDTPPELESIIGVLADCSTELVSLMAIAADVDECWVAGLGQDDGYLLMMVWWNVNGPFFIRRVVNREVARRAVERPPAGSISTAPLSVPDMEAELPAGSDA